MEKIRSKQMPKTFTLSAYLKNYQMWFGLVGWFYGISSIVGYLKPNLVYTFISNI